MNSPPIFRTKSLDAISRDAEKEEYRLRRALGPVQLTLLGIGAIIGAGIFATIGTAAAGDAARPGAGPALMISFVITAIVCGFAALCYAEFAAMVPISGSAYTYSYTTLGELAAWIIGWDLIIEYAVGNIAVAISWANYFKTLLSGFGIRVPDWISMDYRTAAKIVDANGVETVFRDAPHIFGIPIVCNLLSVLIVTLITIVLIWGIRESARFNAVMVGIKIVVLTFFIIVGTMWIKPENWVPFAPNGWSGISAGAAIVFFAYIGFDAVSTAAEETENPQRNMPIGIIASLIICTLFYVIVSAVFTGLVPYPALKSMLATQQAEPLTMALDYASPQLGWAIGIVAFGSVVAHTAVLLVFQLGQPRILFAMSRDGLLPRAFGMVHPKFRTPYVSTIITGVFVGVFAAVASLDEMVDLTNIGTLFAFILVCAGILVLRKKEPERFRPFRVPGGWRWALPMYVAVSAALVALHIPIAVAIPLLVVLGFAFWRYRESIFPLLGIASCLYLIVYLPPTSWLRFAAWLNLGFVIYAGYGMVRSGLTGRQLADDPTEHDARTSITGTRLAVLGTLLLFVMHGLDVWHAAWVGSTLEGWARLVSSAGAMGRSGAWLDLSVFLDVPLALNAFVLCPLLWRRANGARKSGASRSISEATFTAVALAVVATLYLVAVVAHV